MNFLDWFAAGADSDSDEEDEEQQQQRRRQQRQEEEDAEEVEEEQEEEEVPFAYQMADVWGGEPPSVLMGRSRHHRERAQREGVPRAELRVHDEGLGGLLLCR